MMGRKFAKFFVFLILFSFLLFPIVSADLTETVLDTVSGAYSYGSWINLDSLYPSGTGRSFIGESFYSYTNALLHSFTFTAYRTSGSLTGYIRGYIYAETGTFGVSSVGTGEPLATSSNIIDLTTIGTQFNYNSEAIEFHFDDFTIDAGVHYVMGVGVYESDNINSSWALRIHYIADNTQAEGNYASINNGVWSATEAYEVYYVITLDFDGTNMDELQSYTGMDDGHNFYNEHPSATSVNSAFYFTVNNTGSNTSLRLVQLPIYPQGDAEFVCRVGLYAVSGTYNSNAVPTGDCLEWSNNSITYDPDIQYPYGYQSSVSGTRNDWNFWFDGTYQLAHNVAYALVFEITEAITLDSTNRIVGLGHDGATVPVGDSGEYRESAWTRHSAYGYSYYVFVDTYSEPPVPTPTPSPSPSPMPYVTPPHSTPTVTPYVPVQFTSLVPIQYMIILILFSVVAVIAGLYAYAQNSTNKGIGFLMVIIGAVIFLVLLIAYVVSA